MDEKTMTERRKFYAGCIAFVIVMLGFSACDASRNHGRYQMKTACIEQGKTPIECEQLY